MYGHKYLKGTVLVTLFFFVFFIFAVDFVSAQQEEDALLKARKLYQQGDYEGSIKLLGDFIGKLRAMVEQKKNVAEAFYLLAKIYYEVGDDGKVDENLTKCFETFPAFKTEETNLGFKSRVDQIKKDVLENKTRQPKPETEEFEEQEEQPPVRKQVLERQYPEKKKKKFPILLVLGGAVVVGVVLALAMGGKKKSEDTYDIRGNWTLKLDLYEQIYMTFSGSSTSGTYTGYDSAYSYQGTYSVNGRQVQFMDSDIPLTCTGSFSDSNNMSGSYTFTGVGNGSWTAARGFNASTNTTAATTSLKALGKK